MEGRDVAVCDIPGAFMHSDLDDAEVIHIKDDKCKSYGRRTDSGESELRTGSNESNVKWRRRITGVKGDVRRSQTIVQV